MQKTNILLILFLILSPVPTAHADEQGEWDTSKETAPPPQEQQASDAQFDKRLPPVWPGEEISDGKRSMKVWSSAGSPTERHAAPVTVPGAPPVSDTGSVNPNIVNPDIGSIGVLVDQRRRDSESQAK